MCITGSLARATDVAARAARKAAVHRDHRAQSTDHTQIPDSHISVHTVFPASRTEVDTEVEDEGRERFITEQATLPIGGTP